MAFRHCKSQGRRVHALVPLAAASQLVCGAAALAQGSQTVTVTGRSSAANSASVAGFGDVPLSRLPLSATVVTAQQLADAGIGALSDITRLDAAVTDAYNAPGYWGQVAVRGFTLDNRFNYRRDGLPINAETMLPTGNKAALELLKGISGIQAGTSAPGGLMNLVVKRPTAQALRSASLDGSQPASLTAAVDLSDRAGTDGAFGWRLNASATHHEPQTRNSRGHAHLLAGAVEWRLPKGLLEAEFEHSLQSQPSTPGFSLLGNTLPNARDTDPRLNLNNQPWSLPVVMKGNTGSLRYTHDISDDTKLVAHLMQQRLYTDDRIAFPFGLYDPTSFDCDPCDRYTADGRFTVWDFRSEGERRTSTSADISVQSRLNLAGTQHDVSAGLLSTRYRAQFNRQANNIVGVGHTDGSVNDLPADPTLTEENTHRSERSSELHLQDAVTLAPDWQLWAGLRHTQLQRDSVRTDGSRATSYGQNLSTPWLALSWQVNPGNMAYASWGEGVESEVAPGRTRYLNAGQALPALKSRQWELGWKHRGDAWQWQLASYDIQRPQWSDFRQSTGLPTLSDNCSDADPCRRRTDGTAHHRGLEGSAEWQGGPWSLRASAMAQRTRREGSNLAGANGLRPTNVPDRSLKAQAVYNVQALPGLALLAFASHEGQRMVLPDNSVSTPGWTRVDLGLRYAPTTGALKLVWRLGVDNVADTRAWKEAPFQFGHAYLYPLLPRTWRASVVASF
ncbi:outer membrane receptor protein [Burkholderiales bacterium JOSHI_001]|nr:outer membrane receptor protein [Burkholderiales bacterium JOSHI_001]